MCYLQRNKDVIFLSLILIIFFVCICIMNIGFLGKYLTSDMYGDLWVAKLMWEQKTLFPENWVFGNQLYILATPNLAALFYGLTHDMLLSMGMASTIMVILFGYAYYWMLKTTVSFRKILVGMVVLCASFCTVHAGKNQFAQLYLVGCTYYLCYVITLLFNLGVFIRLYTGEGKVKNGMYAVSLLLSFAMGIQSIRQTLLMVLPFLVIQLSMIIVCLIRKQKINCKLLIFVILTSACNFGGVSLSKQINVSRDAIIGSMGISLSDMKAKILCIPIHAKSLIGLDDIIFSIRNSGSNIVFSTLAAFAGLVLLLLVGLSVISLVRKKKLADPMTVLICILFVSCLGVMASFFVLNISRLAKYYFIYFVLVSLLVSELYEKSNNTGIIKGLIIAQAILVLGVAYIRPIVEMSVSTSVYEDIAQYMEANEYSIVYSEWDDAGNVAGASNCKIVAGRWDAANIFQIKAHTNVMGIYTEADNEKALYLLTDKTLKEAEQYFTDSSVQSAFECVATFSDELGNQKYLYKSEKQLMH